jgi:hypothetical protein
VTFPFLSQAFWERCLLFPVLVLEDDSRLAVSGTIRFAGTVLGTTDASGSFSSSFDQGASARPLRGAGGQPLNPRFWRGMRAGLHQAGWLPSPVRHSCQASSSEAVYQRCTFIGHTVASMDRPDWARDRAWCPRAGLFTGGDARLWCRTIGRSRKADSGCGAVQRGPKRSLANLTARVERLGGRGGGAVARLLSQPQGPSTENRATADAGKASSVPGILHAQEAYTHP